MIWGIHISRCVYAVAELGIADLLAGGPVGCAELARITRTHEPSLHRVLRVLAALGVFQEHDGRSFGLTVVGERLRRDAPVGAFRAAQAGYDAGQLRIAANAAYDAATRKREQ